MWSKSSFSGASSTCVEVWRKSSFSGGMGNCVEVQFAKSSFSGTGGSCVEVAMPAEDDLIRVRDDKLGEASPVLLFNRDEWRAFIEGAKAGEFD